MGTREMWAGEWGVGSGGVKSGGQGGEGGAGTQQVHQNLQTNDTSGNEMR
jgi:hypothetical protein